MRKNKEGRAIFAAVAVLFSLFVLGYQGGKQLARTENAGQQVSER